MPRGAPRVGKFRSRLDILALTTCIGRATHAPGERIVVDAPMPCAPRVTGAIGAKSSRPPNSHVDDDDDDDFGGPPIIVNRKNYYDPIRLPGLKIIVPRITCEGYYARVKREWNLIVFSYVTAHEVGNYPTDDFHFTEIRGRKNVRYTLVKLEHRGKYVS